MQIIRLILFSLISLPLLAFNGGSIDEKVMKKAERKYGGLVVSRYVAYNSMLEEAKHFSLHQKLKIVNDFFNKVPYKSDKENWKTQDYWATPLEFLARYKGDSEDYAIAKYFALITLGVEPKTLYFTYVNTKASKEPHMVLSYFKTPESDPFILDNLNPELLNASQRNDLTPVYHFNPSLQESEQENAAAHKKWKKLHKRVKRNKL